MARLVILGGRHEGKRLRLPIRELTIGRDDDCHVTLRTSEVSRKHCVLRVETDDDVFVRDLDSANGTLINDVVVASEVRLNHGDLLTVGPVTFRLELATVPKAMQTPTEEFPAGVEDEGDSSVDATENSIASWLTNGAPADTSSDTAIMKKGDSRVANVDPLADSTVRPLPPAVAAAVGAPSGKKFDSVAEEAEDIIRRHLEEKKKKKKERKKEAAKKS